MNRKKLLIIALAAAAALLAIFVAVSNLHREPEVSGDEVMLRIELDLKEDVGLFIIDSDIDGKEESGGVSNADRTKLKKDEVLYWSIDRVHYTDVPEPFPLTLRFRIVTEYIDPNYENIYPEEYVMEMDEISFTASFGEMYSIRVTGDRDGGYQAVIE